MIAAFESQGELHIVQSVARKGFKAQTVGYCRTEGNAADGTLQVPDWVFDGRPQAPLFLGGHRVCGKCAGLMKTLREPLPPVGLMPPPIVPST